jgi:hypothetical protein
MNLQLFLDAGLSIIPVQDKIPIISTWKKFQTIPPNENEIKSWLLPVAIICGKVSGGLICLDFDNKKRAETMDHYLEWHELVYNHKPELLEKLIIERTPSGGLHVIFRCKDFEIGNQKLANDIDNSILIEIRGEGGYFVCAPSEDYKIITGKFSAIPEFSKEDTEFLLSCARALNKYEKPEIIIKKPNEIYNKDEITPFDDYNAKNTPIELLVKHGWKIVKQRGETIYLSRPGKHSGISASWNNVPNRFYSFTTSTVFENEHIYKASAVYAILEHAGDYSAAAGELARQGYGNQSYTGQKDYIKDSEKPKVYQKLKIITVKDFSDRIDFVKTNGYPKGISTGWTNLDVHFRIAKGQLNIVSGIPTHGKSEFMDALMINTAKVNQWKWLVFSPENYPFEMHFYKLAEKYLGKKIDDMSLVDLKSAKDFIQTRFYFIDPCEEIVSADSVLQAAEQCNPDAMIIDPWNEIESARPSEITETDYIGFILTKIRKFARKNNISVFIIAHPTKMRRDKQSGEFPKPNMYDISGSSHWYNKSDNGLIVWRDFDKGWTEIIVEKVKFKYYGYKTRMEDVLLDYQIKSGRYVEHEEKTRW